MRKIKLPLWQTRHLRCHGSRRMKQGNEHRQEPNTNIYEMKEKSMRRATISINYLLNNRIVCADNRAKYVRRLPGLEPKFFWMLTLIYVQWCSFFIFELVGNNWGNVSDYGGGRTAKDNIRYITSLNILAVSRRRMAKRTHRIPTEITFKNVSE